LKAKGTIRARARARIWVSFDAPPNPLKDSKASLKVKIMEEERDNVCSLTRNTFGVGKACWSSRMGIRKSDKRVNNSHRPIQTKQQVG
jgi:hypothetical protein